MQRAARALAFRLNSSDDDDEDDDAGRDAGKPSLKTPAVTVPAGATRARRHGHEASENTTTAGRGAGRIARTFAEASEDEAELDDGRDTAETTYTPAMHDTTGRRRVSREEEAGVTQGRANRRGDAFGASRDDLPSRGPKNRPPRVPPCRLFGNGDVPRDAMALDNAPASSRDIPRDGMALDDAPGSSRDIPRDEMGLDDAPESSPQKNARNTPPVTVSRWHSTGRGRGAQGGASGNGEASSFSLSRLARAAKNALAPSLPTFSHFASRSSALGNTTNDAEVATRNTPGNNANTASAIVIPEDERLPPCRSRARMGGPRGKQLWRKVRENRKLLIGEFERTGASRYWRQRAGITAFFSSIDRDVNGRAKNRASALRKAAVKLSRRTKFPESPEFLEELAELSYLSKTETHALCKERGLRVRDGPDNSPIDTQLLKQRLLHYAHGRFGVDWFVPSPFGRNKRGYYRPLLFALSQCVMVSTVTVGVTYSVYTFAEHWHAKQHCHKIWNWMNPQCQAADFLRTNAKQAVYRWYYQVGSIVALRAGAWFDALSREAGRLAADATEGLARQMDGGETNDAENALRRDRRYLVGGR
jgi:hypothetical protein